MRKNSLLILSFFISLCSLSAFAAIEMPSEQSFFQVEAPAKAEVDDAFKDVDEKAQSFVIGKKTQLKRTGRINEVFITSGAAVVGVSSNNPDWGDARVMAYQNAQMRAREQLLKQLYSEVASDLIRESFRTNRLPEFTSEELQHQKKLDSILAKVTALTNASLDEKLREKGIDPSQYDKAPPEKRKIMLKQALTKTVTRVSRGNLNGALISKTFETTDRNGNTAVSVVLMTSVKMKNTLSRLRESNGSVRPEKKRSGVNITEFLSANKQDLMYQYGLKLIHDEQGYPVLLSFAQAGNNCNPLDYEACINNRIFSFIEAENDAYSHIAEAYNLNGQLKITSSKGEEKVKSARVIATKDDQQTIEEAVTRIIRETRERSQMTSQAKNLVGVEEVMRWSEKHPISGREINGIVLAWHPVHEQGIRSFKRGKVPSAVRKSSVHSGTVHQESSMELLDDYDF